YSLTSSPSHPRRLPRQTLFPYTTLFRSRVPPGGRLVDGDPGGHHLLRVPDRVPVLHPVAEVRQRQPAARQGPGPPHPAPPAPPRSEEHTSELQSRENLVCRLLLEKKKKT